MEITEIRIFPVEENKLKAFVSVVFDNCFIVSDIKVISGNAGLFLSMPSKKGKNGKFKDIAHPLNKETREWMSDIILAEYEKSLSGSYDVDMAENIQEAHMAPSAQ